MSRRLCTVCYTAFTDYSASEEYPAGLCSSCRSACGWNAGPEKIHRISHSIVPCYNDRTTVYWACGYRNVQMMISFLLHFEDYKEIFAEKIPTILDLQNRLDRAHTDGWDRAGFDQIGQVSGMTTWIGTTEVYVILRSAGIRARIIDFHVKDENNRHTLLIQWIWEYFYERKADSFVPPLYLQYSGHSVTILGVFLDADGRYKCVVCNPKKMREMDFGELGNLVVDALNYLQRPQYQILFVEAGLLLKEEMEASKVVRSIRMP